MSLSTSTFDRLIKLGLSVLRFDGREWRLMRQTRHHGSRFSLTFPHAVARCGRTGSLVLVAADIPGIVARTDEDDLSWFEAEESWFGPECSLYIGLIHSVQAVSTLDSRVVFDFVQPITPRSLEDLLVQVGNPPLRRGANALRESAERYEGVSPKLGQRLITLISSVPENIPALQRIAAQLNKPTYMENARAMQHDALNIALKAFGLLDGPAFIDLPGGDTALATVRLREDTVIEHDARWIPGWTLESSDLTGKAVFVHNGQRLEVFTANKQPLEELFGVDLIYLNQAHRALIMMQYKMMEPLQRASHSKTHEDEDDEDEETDQEWTVSVDAQFKDELARMALFDKDISGGGPFRLNSGAFFFKLVKRYKAAKAAGIILSLGHLNQLIAEGGLTGPRGGLRISYRALDGHYLRSNAFVELIHSGYIGTRGATTDHLEKLIEAALNGGRAVVAAIQSVGARPGDPSVGEFSDIDPIG